MDTTADGLNVREVARVAVWQHERQGDMTQPITTCETAFSAYFSKFPQMTAYTTAVTPHLTQEPTAIPIFVEGSIVLMMAWHDDFLGALVAHCTHQKQAEVREYFSTRGNDSERPAAVTCSLRDLISMGRRRVSLKRRGAALEKLFVPLFGFRPWPSDDVLNRLIDLNIVRQLIVHHGGGTVGDDFWDQLTNKSLVSTRPYGDLLVRSVDHERCLFFLKDAFMAFHEQAFHIKNEMLKRPEWTFKPSRQ